MKPGPNESRLIEAIENSQIADFSASAFRSLEERVLDAAILHDICFGVAMELEVDKPARPVAIPLAGIRIRDAIIAGVLNLEDLRSPDGSSFPKLEFRSCRFEHTINLDRCHLRSLSLRQCVLKVLLCTDAVIDGPVNISEIKPPEADVPWDESDKTRALKARIDKEVDKVQHKQGAGAANGREKCWVVFAGTRIAGRFNAAKATFVAPAKRGLKEYVPQTRHAIFALDLRGAQIQGSVNLRPGVSAHGGVCLNLAKVDGSIWCNGAIFKAVEDCAFSADYASIQGSIYMRPLDRAKQESIRFRARGCIRLFATNIGGSLYLGGARLRPITKSEFPTAGEEDLDALNASNAVIGGSCHLNSWLSEAETGQVYRLRASGDVILRSTRIRGNLVLSGAVLKNLLANNIEVGGRCNFGGTSSPLPKLYLWVTQKIDLSGGRIKGELEMAGARLGTAQKKFKLDVCSIEIGSNCRLCAAEEFDERASDQAVIGVPFRCRGSILMREARIGNSLIMEGAHLQGPEKTAALDLSGALISGDAKLMTWSSATTANSVPFTMTAGAVGLRLSGTKITQKLILNGASLTTRGVAIHAANVEIGGKASLGTFGFGVSGGLPTAFSFHSVGRIVLTSASIKLGLDMSGARIDAITSLTSMVGMSEPDILDATRTSMVLDLTLARAKFIALCESLEGPSKDAKGKIVPIQFMAIGIVKLENAEIDTELKLVNGCFRGQLTAAHAKIGTSVTLERTHLWSGSTDGLLKDTIFSGWRKGRIIHDRDGVRADMRNDHIRRTMLPDLSLHAAKVGFALTVKELRRCDRDECTPGHADDMSHTTIDLRGLHVEELDDQGGAGWSVDGRVRFWLDGFRCKRLPEDLQVRKLQPFRVFAGTVFQRLINASWLPDREEGKEREELQPASGSNQRVIEQLSWWDRTRLMLYGFFERDGPWEERLRWLNLQYFEPGKPLKNEYSPDAFEQIVDSLNSTGSYENARRIASARMTHEKNSMHNRVTRFPWILFRIFFDYGFSVTRAMVTFTCCIVLGWGAAHIANYGPWWNPNPENALIVNTIPPQGVILERGEKIDIHAIKTPAEESYENDLSCGGRVRSILYALDVFLPVLNLHQQEVCTIAPARKEWRYAQAFYAVLGWILTPITILTLTGTLRRHLEK